MKHSAFTGRAMQPFQLFRPGTHTDAGGRVLEFPTRVVREIADAYDPALHEAPIVVGHPDEDAPAYGWIERLAFDGDALTAAARDVEPQFAELVRAGRFRKVSAAFYHPESNVNPRPGVWYLRHVGFLGAQPPAIKGLKPIAFAAGGEGVVTVEVVFGEEGSLAALLRRVRDLLTARAGDEPEAGETEETETTMTNQGDAAADQAAADQAARDAAYAEKEAELQAERAALQAERAAIKAAERQRAAAAFLEPLVAAGRVLPADAPVLTALLARADDEQAIRFAEGDEATERAALEAFLARLPSRIEYREIAPAANEVRLDGSNPGAIAQAAVAYAEHQRSRGVFVSAVEAVRHVTEAKG